MNLAPRTVRDADLRAAIEKIVTLFARQVEDGAQSKPPNERHACGQFLNELTNPQRGIHGTAAAVEVLGSNPAYRELTADLVAFMGDWLESGNSDTGRRLRDRDNVIKVSEALASLSAVPAGVASTDSLVLTLGERLRDASVNGQGWDYFVGGQDIAVIPTALAVRALVRHGFEAKTEAGALLSLAMDESSNAPDPFEQILCLYVLATTPELLIPHKDLRPAFTRIWRETESLLKTPIELNIEYSSDARNFYVRLPWQLYLIGLARVVGPRRRFASRRIQRVLENAVADVRGAGFRYPNSGRALSSRTNAILYEVLDLLSQRKQPVTLKPLLWLDSLRAFFGLVWVKRSLAGLAFLLLLWPLWRWWDTSHTRLQDLGPNIAASLLLALVAIGRRPR